MRKRIEHQINETFQPVHVELIDETGMHNVPPDSESHWRLVLVSEHFHLKSPVQRHRAIYAALAEELRQGIHALALVAFTPAEWIERSGPLSGSPPCMGGSKNDA